MIDRSLVIQLAKARLHVADRLDPVDPADVLARLREFLADLSERNAADITETVIRRARELLADIRERTVADISSAAVQRARELLAEFGGDTTALATPDAVKRAQLLLADLSHSVPFLERSIVLEQARELLADSIEPYRWPDDQLIRFYDQGLLEVDKLRNDIAGTSDVTGDFAAALGCYVASRAVAQDNDYQQNNGALSEKLFSRFVELTMAAPFHWQSSDLEEYAGQGIEEIRKLRNDIGMEGTVTVEFTEALGYYIASRAFNLDHDQKANNGAVSDRLYARFNELVAAVPFRVTDNQLKAFAADAIAEIRKLRNDIDDTVLPSEFLESAGYYTAFLAANLTGDQVKNGGAIAERFRGRALEALALVPYHWTDDRLAAFAADALAEIRKVRADAASYGAGAEFLEPAGYYTAYLAANLTADQLKNGGAIAERFRVRFAETLQLVPFHWGDEQLSAFIQDGIAAVRPMRPDIGGAGTVTVDYADAITRYAAGRAVLVSRDLAAGQAALADKLMQQFRELAAAVPMQYPENRFEEWFDRATATLYSVRPELMLDAAGMWAPEPERIPERFSEEIADYIASLGFLFYNRVNEAAPFRELAAAGFRQL